MQNKEYKNSIVLYHSMHGEIKRDQKTIGSYEEAQIVAADLLSPFMQPGDTITAWECGMGTNFSISNEKEYKADSVLIRGFHQRKEASKGL